MGECLLYRDFFRCAGAPLHELQLSFGQLFSNCDAVGDTDKIGVFEFNSGPFIAIV